MSVQPDPVILKKLVLSKQLFNRALVQTNSFSNIEHLMAVITFDLATETVLNAVVSSLEPNKTPSDGIPSLLNQVDKILSDKNIGNVPDRANIVSVHNIRNDAQHDARYPHSSELSDCQTYTRDFLKKIVKLVWNVDFDKITLTDLIKHEKIKTHLQSADEFLLNGNYKKAIEKATIGFDKALSSVGRVLVGSTSLYSHNKIVVTDPFGRKMAGNDTITKAFERMQETLRLLALGLNSLDFLKYKKITGTPLYSLGNEEPIDFIFAKNDPTKDDAEFVVAYAINSILAIEDKAGDIEKPFGKNPDSIF